MAVQIVSSRVAFAIPGSSSSARDRGTNRLFNRIGTMNDREMDLQKAVNDAEEVYWAAELAWCIAWNVKEVALLALSNNRCALLKEKENA